VERIKMRPHYDVLIATPGKMMHAEYVSSLFETLAWLTKIGLTYKFLNKQSSFIPSGRELTATDTYSHNWDTNEIGSGEYTYGKIFWIDSDIEWDLTAFKSIFLSELDVVSGVYQTHPNGTVAMAMADDAGRPRKVNKVEFLLWGDPFEVLGVGFGFVAMKTGVFEKIKRPWFGIDKIRWDGYDFDTNVGEDYSWCNHAREAGFDIWVDPMVKVKHHKETVYEV
jgi:hypothetical protein